MAIALSRSVTLPVIGLLLAVSWTAEAQRLRQPLHGEPLTLDRALTLAEHSNPQLRVADAAVEGAEAGIQTARQRPNPEFSSNFGRQTNFKDSAIPGQLGWVSIAQPWEWGSVRRARVGVAGIARDGANLAREETRIAVRAAVKQAFYDVLRRDAETDLAEDSLRNIEELRRRVEVQVQVGEAARLELTRADAELATARIHLRSAEMRLSTAVAGLRAAIGAPLDGFVPQGPLAPKTILPPLTELREQVIARHPGLAQAQSEIRRADAQLGLEREMRKPTATLRTDFERVPDARAVRFGITVPIPAWNRRQGEIAEAAASLRHATATADARRLEITAALERAYGVYEVANEQVAALEAGALRQAEAALQASEAAFRFGERGILEVLDAQRVLRGVRFDYLNAQYDRQAALIELERLQAVDLGSGRP
jgi:cobalt-zinc-cadmium efflux system outer membrane protein